MTKKKLKIGIAISGGGSKGAFSVGAINAIRSALDPSWDIVSGTSTGSLIGTLIATRQWQRLSTIYSSVKTENIVSPRHKVLGVDLGPLVSLAISAITGSESVFTTDGLASIIDSTIPDFEVVKNSKSLLLYTATELQSGEGKVFDNRKFAASNLRKALLASANQPVLMEPVTINGKQYVDGGVVEYLPLSAIFKRPESSELDYIFAISSSPISPETKEEKFKDSISILERTLDMFGSEVAAGDVIAARAINIARKLYDELCRVHDGKLFLKDEDSYTTGRTQDLSEEEETWIAGKKYIPIIWIDPGRHITEMSSLDFDSGKMKKLMTEGENRTFEILKSNGLI